MHIVSFAALGEWSHMFWPNQIKFFVCAIRLFFMLHLGVPSAGWRCLWCGPGLSLFHTSGIISNPDI